MDTYQTVEEYLQRLDEVRQQVVELRKYILETEPNLVESIKWNAPDYSLNGEDRITFNTHEKSLRGDFFRKAIS